jgi:peptide/nickel transport system substrate-binding protein
MRCGAIMLACMLVLAVAGVPVPVTGAMTLTIDLQGDPATLDPGRQYDTNSYDVYRNIYDNLLHRNPQTSAIEPWIATQWRAVTPTEWQFTIRRGVKFHDGSDLTAADVVASLQRILDRQFNSPQYANFSAISSVRATGPDTVVIATSRPYPVLLAQLVNLSVVSAAYLRAHDQPYVNAHPMGSGPYRFVTWLRGDHVTLRSAGEHWHGRPDVDEVTFRAVPEDATRVADLQSGRAQLALGLTSDDVRTIKSDAKLQMLGGATERIAYLAFNALGSSSLRDVQAREAIAHAINRPALMQILLSGYALPVTEFLTGKHVGYDPKLNGYEYNLAKSRQLLAAAGHPGGLALTFTTSPTYDQRIVQAIQGQLQQAGVTVRLQSYDFGTYLQKIQSPQHDWGDLRFGQWSCACLDADGVIYPLFHTGSIWSSFSDPAFDAAVDSARATLDARERAADYATALQVLQKDVAGVPLWQVVALYGASRTLRWHPTVDEQLFVAEMSAGH